MTLSSNEDYVDIDAFLKDGTIKANFNENVECCAKACFYWYYEYSKKNYAHKSESSSSSSSTGNTSGSSSTITGDNLVRAWGNVNDVIPAGWTAVDNGSQRQTGSQSSGPRVMQFYQGGDMTTAFYVREISSDRAGYIEYGGQSGYTLPLVYGEYQLSCNIAAWKGRRWRCLILPTLWWPQLSSKPTAASMAPRVQPSRAAPESTFRSIP